MPLFITAACQIVELESAIFCIVWDLLKFWDCCFLMLQAGKYMEAMNSSSTPSATEIMEVLMTHLPRRQISPLKGTLSAFLQHLPKVKDASCIWTPKNPRRVHLGPQSFRLILFPPNLGTCYISGFRIWDWCHWHAIPETCSFQSHLFKLFKPYFLVFWEFVWPPGKTRITAQKLEKHRYKTAGNLIQRRC